MARAGTLATLRTAAGTAMSCTNSRLSPVTPSRARPRTAEPPPRWCTDAPPVLPDGRVAPRGRATLASPAAPGLSETRSQSSPSGGHVLIPFIGYAVGRRLIGYVDCENERLTDLLNRSESLVIPDAFVETFAAETIVNLGDGEIDRSILYAVDATGGRGEGARRIHTD